MTSLTPSRTLEPPTPPTRGWTRDLIASMEVVVVVVIMMRGIQCCEGIQRYSGGSDGQRRKDKVTK